jgi:4-hydroxy-3-methylbut-2-enyl diphosphate reductase
VEIGEKELPTFFIRDASQIKSLEEIVHYDLHHQTETTSNYANVFAGKDHIIVGLTAGASCPNNLIEATVKKVFELRGEKL